MNFNIYFFFTYYIALFCNVKPNAVIESIDVDTIYDVPLVMQKEKLDKVVMNKLKLVTKNEPDLTKWKEFLYKLKQPSDEVKIALVGKYVELPDAYKSIAEAFIHAGSHNECKVRLSYVHSELIDEQTVEHMLKDYHAILVAPGFGSRGIEGKLIAIKYARETNIPFFGICLGMQCAVIEFARNVLHLKTANSAEIDPKSKAKVIDMMEAQKKVVNMGGTMRLGAYDCTLEKGSRAAKAYGKTKISERHRHRYEFNDKFKEDFEKAGMLITGTNPETGLAEVVEIDSHPYFIGVQYHPELKSTVENPHPLFVSFVKAAMAFKNA